jgi:YaiO family outer membrane protein
MKHTSILLASVLALSSLSAGAATPTGNFEASTSAASVSKNYASQKIQSASVLVDVKEGTKLGLYATNVDAWGQTATYLAARVVQDLSSDLFVDATYGGSDQGAITAQSRAVVMLKTKVLPAKNLIIGAGVDYSTMRHGADSKGLMGQAVYYVPGMPLVLQGDVRAVESEAGGRVSTGAGIGMTYGAVGNWTVSARYDSGHVNYQLVSQPNAVANYLSSTSSIGTEIWVKKDMGFRLSYSIVNNQYYVREEAKAGVVYRF